MVPSAILDTTAPELPSFVYLIATSLLTNVKGVVAEAPRRLRSTPALKKVVPPTIRD
jgi:hypothetical protein